jgi:hypothetical protein
MPSKKRTPQTNSNTISHLFSPVNALALSRELRGHSVSTSPGWAAARRLQRLVSQPHTRFLCLRSSELSNQAQEVDFAP